MKLLLPSLLLSLLLPGSDQKQGKQGKCGNRMSNQGNKNPPHIILILADDLGWNEVRRFYWRKRKYSNQVSWHNPSFKTPRMEELSLDGVRLSKSYVSPKCSPSRAALMTGLYPWRLGLHCATNHLHPHHHRGGWVSSAAPSNDSRQLVSIQPRFFCRSCYRKAATLRIWCQSQM